jgi:1-acyl-sn-glycerol-3-phosphate acyltransferase
MELVAPHSSRDVDGDPAAAGWPSWSAPLIWRVLQDVGRVVVAVVCRFRVTGEVAPDLRRGPLILAANHISNFDPICMTAGSRSRGVSPRIMATGGLFRPPVVGWVMTRSGHLPVNRGQDTVAHAVPTALSALREGAPVCIYPEGRIGLDPALWPERAKTGLARLALATGAPVIPVAIWGSHEVMAYHGRATMVRTLLSSIWRRPKVRMRFGAPVDLSDLREGAVGDAQRATDRIMAALIRELATLRLDEPGVPRFIDPTRPVSTARSYRGTQPTVRMLDHDEVVRAPGP